MDDEFFVNPVVEDAVRAARSEFRKVNVRTQPGEFDRIRKRLLANLQEAYW